MKTIKITISIDGNEVSRDYADDIINPNWDDRVNDMLDTLEKSNEEF